MPADLPVPPVPSDLDLRHFGFMPLWVDRLLKSELAAVDNAEAFRAAVLLWCLAWQEVPCGSIPNNDRWISTKVGLDIRAWRRVREIALHGFLLHSDGRLYHAVVCENALERARKSKKTEAATKAAAAARSSRRKSSDINTDITDNGYFNGSPHGDRDGQSNGSSHGDRHGGLNGAGDKREEERKKESLPPPLEQEAAREPWGGETRPKAISPEEQPWADLGSLICDEFDRRSLPIPHYSGFMAQWREAKYDPTLIGKTIRESFAWADKKGKKIRGLAFFRGQIEADQGIVAEKLPPKVETSVIHDPDRWRTRLQKLQKDDYWVSTSYGPRPGAAGCQVPIEVLREFGF